MTRQTKGPALFDATERGTARGALFVVNRRERTSIASIAYQALIG